MDAATRLRGCLLAGAVGDALGAPLEFHGRTEIERRWGRGGPTGYVDGSWPAGSITDDTQMNLFTAEGMIRARRRMAKEPDVDPVPFVHRAYLRWLHTQAYEIDASLLDGWLVAQRVLHARRAPGNTCLSGLTADRMGTAEAPLNGSKGCGTVMRMAPAALWDHVADGPDACSQACAYGALTHGHPTGYLAGGALACMLASLLRGEAQDTSMGFAMKSLKTHAGKESGEVLMAIFHAADLAFRGVSGHEGVEQLGEGWIAEEALAIGLFSFLTAPDVRTGLRVAVAHDGDSDSTGAVAGYLLGAYHGPDAIPADLLEGLEARDVIDQVAADLAGHFLGAGDGGGPEDSTRYPDR